MPPTPKKGYTGLPLPVNLYVCIISVSFFHNNYIIVAFWLVSPGYASQHDTVLVQISVDTKNPVFQKFVFSATMNKNVLETVTLFWHHTM